MAETNWRDLYEDRDKDGDEVVDVWVRDGAAIAYVYRNARYNGKRTHTLMVGQLVPKPKPKTYRPYKRDELKCGMVFRHKESGVDYMVTVISDEAVRLGSAHAPFVVLFNSYTQLDGSPAGVLE